MESRTSSEPLLGDGRDVSSPTFNGTYTDDSDENSSTISHFFSHCRRRLRIFIGSRAQHYYILTLVALDVLTIFAEISISLHTCKLKNPSPRWEQVREGLGIASLVFSCLFMIELISNIWHFGLRYFESTFRVFDAVVIIVSFVIDVLLHGVLEEVASLVIILRFWRFIKVVEEFGVGAEEQMEELRERTKILDEENEELKRELRMKGRYTDDEEMDAVQDRAAEGAHDEATMYANGYLEGYNEAVHIHGKRRLQSA